MNDLKDCNCEACPTGDMQPQCPSDACKGQNGVCTNKNKGCKCKMCPDHEMTPFCGDCGGADGKKCKGVRLSSRLETGLPRKATQLTISILTRKHADCE